MNFKDYCENVLSEGIDYNKNKEIMMRYKDNPFGIGANSISFGEKWVTLRFEENYYKNQTKEKLQKLGVKNISSSKKESSFKFRYELHIPIKY